MLEAKCGGHGAAQQGRTVVTGTVAIMVIVARRYGVLTPSYRLPELGQITQPFCASVSAAAK